MKRPLYLREGSTIWITAPARKVKLKEIEPAILILKTWGYKVKIGSTIARENNQFSGTDQERSQDFQNALNDPETNAIWCAKGGYGTIRIVDALDFTKFLKHPKWIIGYSDITVLHARIHDLKVLSLHATMPIDITTIKKKALSTLKKALAGTPISYKISAFHLNRKGVSKGQLIGGNLSVLYSMLGAPGAIDTNGKILFLEDLDEYLYHIDRMLINLKRNGYFNGLKGLIIGGMTQLHDNTIPFGKNYIEIILDITAEYDFPIAFNFPAGHIEDNRTLVFGEEITLDVSSKQTLVKMNI